MDDKPQSPHTNSSFAPTHLC